ncbi:MAG: DUF3592 domain-containing protein [Phycisphaerae bacterium]
MDKPLPDWIPFTLVIVVILLMLWWKFADELRFRWRAQWAEGRITNWMGATVGGKRVFHPIIEFHTAEGVHMSYRAEEQSEDRPMYEPGTIVRVKYDPRNPRRVKTIYPRKGHT